MTYTVKIWQPNAERLKPICEATRYHPARMVNMLLEYALARVRLTPTTATVYDIRFFDGSDAPSRANTMQIFPQLADPFSGIKSTCTTDHGR